MPPSAKFSRTRVVRLAKRAHYDRATIDAILDEALVCHVGFVHDGHPAVIPTAHWRDGDRLYFHGSAKSRMLGAVRGAEVCVAVTLMDGLVMARSGFHHSINYRSVVVYGRAEAVDAPAAKVRALRAFMERVAPGRWDEIDAVRPPTASELKSTQVMALPLTEASAKVREGPPVDDEADYALPIWAGVVPMATVFGRPVPDPRLSASVPLPAYLRRRRR